MLDKLMQFGLNNRLVVLVVTAIILFVGTFIALHMPIDVFPDLTAPTVTILTEAHGMAPEEVETLVTFPIETALNGSSGVRRVRSTSVMGFSTIYIEFDWGTDIYRARQIVNEKLQMIRTTFPAGVEQPILAPITSIMGEIMMVGITGKKSSLMELRTLADFTLKRRLLAVPGVANVKVYGGDVKQYQVLVNPSLLLKYDVTLNQVLRAVKGSNINAAGGFYISEGREFLIRGLGRIRDIHELQSTVVAVKDGVSVLLRDVGDVVIGPATRLGAASINLETGVLVLISKQPDANTVLLTQRLDETFSAIQKTLPEDIRLHTQVFKQADFISLAVNNVFHALIFGAVLVIFILALFLGNIRTTLISIVAIPISLIVSILILRLFNLSINTMTLGGMAIAIGILVDDAIIYVENVYRRLQENARLPESSKESFYHVVWRASKEIRTPIAMATFIIVVVFVPLFFLSGIEGRMLKPLGIAYTVSVFASLLVAVTVTPALSSLLLRQVSEIVKKDNLFVKITKRNYASVLQQAILHTKWILGGAGILLLSALLMMPFLGRSFLPDFNEGTFNISIATAPGTALEQSDKIGRMAESLLLSETEILSVVRRTGRTELDEHALGSHAHELEVRFDQEKTTKNQIIGKLREQLRLLPGSIFIIGQPISHRIDHMLSGTRANIAIKIFGSDLDVLKTTAQQIENEIKNINGVVDLSIDQQVKIPQVKIRPNRQKMALYGITVGDVDEMIDIAFLGVKASQIYEGQNQYDLVVRYAPAYRSDSDVIGNSLINTPSGAQIPLAMVADISIDQGPNYISRENVQRKIVVQANISGRDLIGVVNEIKQTIDTKVKLPRGYFIDYGGQFESAATATRMITLLSLVSVLAIFLALYLEFRSFRQSLLVMVNLPLALIGGIMMIFIGPGVVTIASLVGFVTLFGIAVRNGIIMISHYNHLIQVEKISIRQAVVQGSLERLNPILMTALSTGLALLPLALAADQPGSEIQAPMSMVILGGLVTATFLNMIVVPILFLKWGIKRIKIKE